MSNITTIGVIGLGNAGAPILNNLDKSNKYKLVTFDIDSNLTIGVYYYTGSFQNLVPGEQYNFSANVTISGTLGSGAVTFWPALNMINGPAFTPPFAFSAQDINGATTDPSASINKPPKIIITTIIGASQTFLRTLRNNQSSFNNSILFLF